MQHAPAKVSSIEESINSRLLSIMSYSCTHFIDQLLGNS